VPGNLPARVLGEGGKAPLPTERKGDLLSRNLERNFAGASASRNGQAGRVFPVPTSRFIRTRRRPNPRRHGQCRSGVRVNHVPCTPLRRAPLPPVKLLQVHRRKLARSMAGRNRR
jgi:hypothetical protein